MHLKISLLPISFDIKEKDAALRKTADYLKAYLQENGIESNIEIWESLQLPEGSVKKTKNSIFISDDEQVLEYIENLPIKGEKFAITKYRMGDEVSTKVIGISSPGRSAMLISWELLGREKNLDKICTRAAKEIMHELGHNFGIVEHHPWGYKCTMVETEDDTGGFSPKNIDKKTYKFCADCRKKITVKMRGRPPKSVVVEAEI